MIRLPSPTNCASARLLLIHVPARDAVIPKLVRALKPGGWLVVEEYDLFPARPARTAPGRP